MDAVVNAIQSFVFSILLSLDSLVYSLVGWVYQIILVLCNFNILENDFEMQALVGRIYIIIGVVILFLVAYSLLKSMVNPDEALKGKKSPVVILKDVIISVVLIAVVPTIFEFAIGLQSALLTKNTIGSLILGSSVSVGAGSESSGNVIKSGGITIATGVLEAFIHPDYSKDKCTKVEATAEYPNGYNCDDITIKTSGGELTFKEFWKEMQISNNLSALSSLSDYVVGSGPLTYNFIISTIAGAFVLLVLISYCFDIAIRAVKLAVFELIAPLPILARILPNEQGSKTFNNWMKATISTYVEVFIRLAILFFAVLIIKILDQNKLSIFKLFQGEAGQIVGLFAMAFLIMGIILFIKQAPEIIKEITGLDSSKYNVLGSAMRGLSMIGAPITGAVRGFNTTEMNEDHKLRSIRNKFANTIGGGLKSLYNTAGKEYKSPKDIISNTHSAVEDVISKQRKRQAAQIAKDNEVEAFRTKPQGDKEPDWYYAMRSQKGMGARFGNFVHNKATDIKDWAGMGDFDSASLTRTKELASKIESNFSALEGVWKKKQEHIDAKSKKIEADNFLKSMQQSMINRASELRTELYDVVEAELKEQYKDADGKPKPVDPKIIEATLNDRVNKAIQSEFGKTLAQAQHEAKLTGDNQKRIERKEQRQKAEPIAAAARQMQLAAAQYSDIKLDKEKILDRISTDKNNPDRVRISEAVDRYGDLSIGDNYELFKQDLRSESDEIQDYARDFIEYLDNMKKEAAMKRDDAVYAESVKGGETKKKEEK